MVDFVYALVIYIVFALILLFGLKVEKTRESSKVLYRYNRLRGLFAIEIVVGHVIRYDNTLLYPLGKFMIISVAFFFFVSSYGMVQSFYRKENYLKGFLAKKCGYIFLLAAITYIVNVILSHIFKLTNGYNIATNNILKNFFVETNWYIWELIAFYIIFYFCYKYLEINRCIVFTIITFVLITVAFLTGFIEGYYASGMAFPFGIIVGEYYEQISKWLRSAKGIVLTIIGSVLGFASLLLGGNSLLGMVYLRNFMCISGIIILMYIIFYFEFDNRVLQFLSKYSTEIYLFQFIWLRVSVCYGWDWKIRIPFVLMMTLISAVIMHFIILPIKRLQKGK